MSADVVALAYLVAGVLFILALRGLSNPETSRRGNLFGMIGMAVAVATTLAAHPPVGFAAWVLVVVGVALGGGAGAMIARRVPMTSMPGLVALVVWFFVRQEQLAFWLIAAVSFLLGVLIIIPIGGADMPVVISMLNSYSGWAAAGIGFTLGNSALIITGALVGSSGAILSYIMCRGMNRNFFSVILGGFGGEVAGPAAGQEQRPVKLGSADDAAFIMKNASKVIIVPGYGMAVAQAQHALREMADRLKKEGVEVKYAIHPVAGRMPGHMNVLLAEANVPYDEVFELEDINSEFAQTDVAFVIGANDVTNPAAKEDPSSPIYGMPVLEVWKAGTVMFSKRSLSSGYAGIDNTLFYRDNTMMLLGDAKKMTENIVKGM